MREILTFEQKFNESISIDFKAKSEGMYIEIESEWAGNSETGFGALVGIELNRDQIRELKDFLTRWLHP